MSTYKVLQDIEAEDKLLGPLTLKQFVFAIITVCLGFIAFFSAQANILLGIPWIIPIAFFGFMATPIGRDQPNDVWLAARIRFLIKPRKRVWDQSGMQELVTITAPKKVEVVRTDGLSQNEVKSRLSALSSMMDTRGWAIKNVDPSASFGSYGNSSITSGERLFSLDNSSFDSSLSAVHPSEDILDPLNNSTAQRIDSAIRQRQQEKLAQLKNSLGAGLISENTLSTPQSHLATENYDFIINNQPPLDPGYATFGSKVVAPSSSEGISPLEFGISDTKPLMSPVRSIIEPMQTNSGMAPGMSVGFGAANSLPVTNYNNAQTPVTETAPNAILKELGQANDISVASIADLAKHAEQETDLSDDDIVTLH